MAQAIPVKTWNFTIRKSGATGHTAFAGTNVSTTDISHTDKTFANTNDTGRQNLSWSYGSGNYVRPNSRSCKFFIKF